MQALVGRDTFQDAEDKYLEIPPSVRTYSSHFRDDMYQHHTPHKVNAPRYLAACSKYLLLL